MEAKSVIFNKLEAFIKKFYTNEIIKGSILFVALGLLYFIFTFLVEHFLWLSTSGRTILFWLFIIIEFVLLAKFIFFPLTKLIKLQKGINFTTASKIIGNHFPELGDKLLNFLQLSNSKENSELLLASIDQKANDLQPIPFTNAVDFSKNKKYLPYALIPVIALLLFFVTGNQSIIKNSFTRVVHYEQAYTPPAPFSFFIVNNNLEVQQNKSYTLKVITKGNVVPDQVKINFNNESYYLLNNKGNFEYTFDNVQQNIAFNLSSNEVVSQNFILKVIEVPIISDFEMHLLFPHYLNKKNEIIKGSGNAVVPEGTQIVWKLNTLATDNIKFITDKEENFRENNNSFILSKVIRSNFDYKIVISNKSILNFESLNYSISVTKDQFPTINAHFAPDSLKLKEKVIIGQVADDYGLSKLNVVYYDVNNNTDVKTASLPVKKDLVDRFVYTFPNGLNLKEGIKYDYYFEVFDNDVVNGNKSAKSSVFSHYELTNQEIQDKNLLEQQENINALEKSLQSQDKQLSELDKLQKLNKEKSNLNYQDQKKIEDFINRQKQQEEMMKEFSKNLEENLEKFQSDNKDKEELQRRLEEFQKESEKNKKLLMELEELSKKLQKEELFDKTDKLKQNAKSQKMNLEQLVELTKRFYVEEKAQQLADKLQKIGDKQENLADKEINTKEKQEELNKEFDDLTKELNDLKKDNEELNNPIGMDNEKSDQEDVKNDQQKATEDLEKQNKSKASKSQKSAGSKMKKMGQKLSASLSSSSMTEMAEDAKLLRQIVDNLLTFSFEQEQLMNNAKGNSKTTLQLNQLLKKQQSLKVQFKHIDDSLFSVALRNPKLTEFVFKEIGEVHYNIDKSLEVIAESNLYKGASHQQFSLTSANRLADFLSNVQSEMQMEMQGMGQGMPKPGKGQGQGMQLPDIIKKQGELGEKMKNGMKPGEEKGEKPGQKNPGQSGQSGSEGKNGSEGNAGKILEILKEQKQLRDALQNELNKSGFNGMGQNALNQMKDIERQLLNKGFKNETLNKMMSLNHELLKLEKAIQEQGQDSKRKSNSNKDSFEGSSKPISPELKEYLNSVEILNRQTLPLQQNYNQKVQEYFKPND